MAAINGNNAYLKFGSTVFNAYWTKELTYNPSVDTEDVTAGSGATHIAREAKLKDNKMGFKLLYDDTAHAAEIADVDIGSKETLIYGPESNVAGKPCFSGPMILTDVKLSQSVEKIFLAYELSFVQAGAPTKTLEGGGTF